jgi:hypothetical protein
MWHIEGPGKAHWRRQAASFCQWEPAAYPCNIHATAALPPVHPLQHRYAQPPSLASAGQEELDAFIKSADTSGSGQIRYEELCARFGDLNVVDDKG